MAPLSVDHFNGGRQRSTPSPSHRSAAAALSCGLAATPPTITRQDEGYSASAARHLEISTSRQASTNEAATSGGCTPGLATRYRSTADLSPENEKSSPCRSIG